MMCLAASASHTGHGTDSRCKTPRLTCTTPAVPRLKPFGELIVAELPCQPRKQCLANRAAFTNCFRAVGYRSITVRTGPTFRLDADSVVDGVADSLLAAKVSFGSLHRYMAKQKLNLV
jgi:hypothetical protein